MKGTIWTDSIVMLPVFLSDSFLHWSMATGFSSQHLSANSSNVPFFDKDQNWSRNFWRIFCWNDFFSSLCILWKMTCKVCSTLPGTKKLWVSCHERLSGDWFDDVTDTMDCGWLLVGNTIFSNRDATTGKYCPISFWSNRTWVPTWKEQEMINAFFAIWLVESGNYCMEIIADFEDALDAMGVNISCGGNMIPHETCSFCRFCSFSLKQGSPTVHVIWLTVITHAKHALNKQRVPQLLSASFHWLTTKLIPTYNVHPSFWFWIFNKKVKRKTWVISVHERIFHLRSDFPPYSHDLCTPSVCSCSVPECGKTFFTFSQGLFLFLRGNFSQIISRGT